MLKFRRSNAVLILGFGAILACMLGSIYIGFQHLEATRQAWLRDAAFREKVRAAFLMREAVRERSFRLTFAATLDDFFERDEQRDYFRSSAAGFLTAREDLEKLHTTTGENEALENLMDRIVFARPIVESTMTAIVEEGYGEGIRTNLEDGLKAQSMIIEALNAFVEVVEASSMREAVAASKAIANTQRNMMFLSGGAVALALAIGVLVLIREGRLKRRLREHRDRLARMSTTDALTGIANRRRFDEFFDLAWHQACRSGLPLSLIMIDVDHFKLYNDEYGHASGDDCLAAVAGAMEGKVERSTDLAARFGGEEFACVLPDTDADGAHAVAEAIREGVAALVIPHAKSSAASHVTVSVGVATCIPTPSDDPSRFFEAADGFLYQAKNQGRDRVIAGSCAKEREMASTPVAAPALGLPN